MTALPPIEAVASGTPPYATVLFDLDGTLTDPIVGSANGTAYALAKLGRPPVDRATISRLIGPPLLEGYMTVLGMTHGEAAETLTLYREYYSTRGLFENVVYGLRHTRWTASSSRSTFIELLRQSASSSMPVGIAEQHHSPTARGFSR